jgi:general secretion pathway protein A
VYLSFFGLLENPFNLTPDPKYLFMSESHREAIDCLRYGIKERKGFVEVVGGIGTGKTTICRAILNELSSETKTAFIFNTSLSDIDLLKKINEEFGIDACGKTIKELIDSLNRFLIEELSRGGNAALIIDEAQNLSRDLLEQIRMLSNLETDQEKLIQIILVGQPELHDLLKTPPLRQLNERISVRSFLRSLSESETWAYIHHRLAIAGSKGEVRFTEGAIRSIYRYSMGNPRKINNLCDRALLIAYTRDSFRITRSHCEEAISEIEGISQRIKSRKARVFYQWSRPFIIVPLLLLAFGVGWIIGPWLSKYQNYLSSLTRSISTIPSKPPILSTINGKKDNGEFLGLKGYREPPFIEWETLRELFHLFAINDNDMEKLATSTKIIGIAQISRLARKLGLDCIYSTVDSKRILSFRVPCLLEVYPLDLRKRNFLIFKEIKGEKIITLHLGGKERAYSIDDLQRIWFGQCLIFYPITPHDDDPILKEGMKHPSVGKLQEILSYLGYYEGVESCQFDEKTKIAVLKFQKDLGISMDGIVGRKTKAFLFQLTGNGLNREGK